MGQSQEFLLKKKEEEKKVGQTFKKESEKFNKNGFGNLDWVQWLFCGIL